MRKFAAVLLAIPVLAGCEMFLPEIVREWEREGKIKVEPYPVHLYFMDEMPDTLIEETRHVAAQFEHMLRYTRRGSYVFGEELRDEKYRLDFAVGDTLEAGIHIYVYDDDCDGARACQWTYRFSEEFETPVLAAIGYNLEAARQWYEIDCPSSLSKVICLGEVPGAYGEWVVHEMGHVFGVGYWAHSELEDWPRFALTRPFVQEVMDMIAEESDTTFHRRDRTVPLWGDMAHFSSCSGLFGTMGNGFVSSMLNLVDAASFSPGFVADTTAFPVTGTECRHSSLPGRPSECGRDWTDWDSGWGVYEDGWSLNNVVDRLHRRLDYRHWDDGGKPKDGEWGWWCEGGAIMWPDMAGMESWGESREDRSCGFRGSRGQTPEWKRTSPVFVSSTGLRSPE